MGTGNTISYSNKPASTSRSSGGLGNVPNQSPYFYGIVTFVDNQTRAIQFTTLKNNIGADKIGDAKPAYKDNITLPQVDDVIPLFTGPSLECGPLGEQDTCTVYYLNPISTLQELNKNSLVRSSNISATPASVNLNKQDINVVNIGFVRTDNGITTNKLPKNLKIDLTGRWFDIAFSFITSKEDFISKPIWDANAIRAGYGTDNFVTTNGQVLPVVKTTVFTIEDAKRTLKYDIQNRFSKGVIKQIDINNWNKLNDRQKASLVSYAYNAGPGTLKNRGITNLIKSGSSPEKIAALIQKGPVTSTDAITKIQKILNGLVIRRNQESTLYLS